MVIQGYKIPKGVQVVFPTLVTGKMEEFVSESNKFMPERWMKNSTQKMHPFASLPYGYGARMCLGRRFADLEIQILLAKVGVNKVNISTIKYVFLAAHTFVQNRVSSRAFGIQSDFYVCTRR